MNSVAIPCVSRHIRELHGDVHILVEKQVVEHLRRLCSRHTIGGTELAIAVAAEISDMLARLEPVGNTGFGRVSNDAVLLDELRLDGVVCLPTAPVPQPSWKRPAH